jgi:hypothetical protein
MCQYWSFDQAGNSAIKMRHAGVTALKRKELTPNVQDSLSEMHELCGPPLLLSGEEKAHYDKVTRAIIEAVNPTDAVELLWTNDIIYHCFDIIRLRRMKIGLMETARNREIASFQNCSTEAEETEGADDVVHDDAVSAMEEARHLERCLNSFAAFDRLLSVSEGRKAAILHHIDMRRSNFADRLRTISREVIEGEIEERESTLGPSATTARGARGRRSVKRVELHSPSGQKRKAS